MIMPSVRYTPVFLLLITFALYVVVEAFPILCLISCSYPMFSFPVYPSEMLSHRHPHTGLAMAWVHLETQDDELVPVVVSPEGSVRPEVESICMSSLFFTRSITFLPVPALSTTEKGHGAPEYYLLSETALKMLKVIVCGTSINHE